MKRFYCTGNKVIDGTLCLRTMPHWVWHESKQGAFRWRFRQELASSEEPLFSRDAIILVQGY